jgi:uncharacterized membrane protein
LRDLFALGWLVILAGFAMVVIGASTQGSVSSGGVVFIGPFPIVFGTGLGGAELALVSVVIGGVMLALAFLWSRRTFGGV